MGMDGIFGDVGFRGMMVLIICKVMPSIRI